MHLWFQVDAMMFYFGFPLSSFLCNWTREIRLCSHVWCMWRFT